MNVLLPQNIDGLQFMLKRGEARDASGKSAASSRAGHRSPAGTQSIGNNRKRKPSRTLTALAQLLLKDIRQLVGGNSRFRHFWLRTDGIFRTTALARSKGVNGRLSDDPSPDSRRYRLMG
jgi:hypothetical protein